MCPPRDSEVSHLTNDKLLGLDRILPAEFGLQEADCEDGLLFLYPQFPLPSARTAKTDAPPGHVRSLKDSSPIVSPSSVAISLPALCAKLTGRTRSAAVAPLMNVLMIAQIAGVRVKTDQVDQFPATKRFR